MSFDAALAALAAAHADELRHASREGAHERLDLEARIAELSAELSARQVVPSPQAAPLGAGAVLGGPAAVAVDAALADWRAVIQEPPGSGAVRIHEIIEACGWGYSVVSADERAERRRAGAEHPDRYTHNGDFSWCGCAVGSWWGRAGLRPVCRPGIDERSARSYMRTPLKVFSSCYRLVHHYAMGTTRVVDPEDVQAGDIVIVGPKPGHRKARSWGAHVTMATGPLQADGEVPTVEGNAKGAGPNGDTYEGVVCRSRPLASNRASVYRVLHCIRPIAADFAEV